MGHFKDLKAWQHARQLVVLSKGAIARLPHFERDALADQWRCAAYSVALNIAEGASRRGVKDFRKHLDIARASLSEIEAILDLAVALGYLQLQDLTQVEATRESAPRRSTAAEEASRGSEATWTLGSVNRLRLAAGGY